MNARPGAPRLEATVDPEVTCLGGHRKEASPPVGEVRQRQVAGLRLLELVRGFTRGIIIDALKSPAEAGRQPGEVVRYEAKGHRLGHDMPEEVIVFAIEAADVETFGEELSPAEAAAARQVLELVRREVAA